MLRRLPLLALGLALAASTSVAHDTLTLDELSEVFGWDMDNVEVTSESVTDSLHVLFGVGGNIAVSIGDDGVLIVDDQFPAVMKKIERAIRRLGGRDIDFAINTHWHFDHADGNLSLGPKGTWLVSQKNSRDMMTGDHIINLVDVKYEQKAYPEDARPHLTYNDRMQMHFNGQQIDLVHTGPAHTSGDTAVIFRGDNAVHLGDVFNNTGYPFIDADNGGDLSGMIAFCQAVLDEIDETTKVIPGHGPVTDYKTLADYIYMLDTMRWRIGAMIKSGKSLEEIVAAEPSADFDERYGTPGMFLNRAYTSLKREFDGS